MVSHQITLRAWSTNADLPPIKINQGDILSRTVFITLISGGQAVDLTNSSVRVHFSKPDGTVVYLTASIVNATAGIISVTLDSQCTAAPGLVKSIVQVTGPNGENLFFVGLNFQVAAVNIEDSIVSSNEFTALTDALAVVQDIDNKADKTTTDNLQDQIDTHTSRTDNPHGVTAAQVGAIPASQKGAAGGVASLDASGKLVSAQRPQVAATAVTNYVKYHGSTANSGYGDGNVYLMPDGSKWCEGFLWTTHGLLNNTLCNLANAAYAPKKNLMVFGMKNWGGSMAVFSVRNEGLIYLASPPYDGFADGDQIFCPPFSWV